jgi:WD40 repeat protein
MGQIIERRFGILIASSRFPEEPKLSELRCPENDVDGLLDVLMASDRGQFDKSGTVVFKNAPSYHILRTINQTLKRAAKEDLVLIYYSGHGKQDLAGRLYMATADTSIESLESTSLPVDRILGFIEIATCSKIVLILDCCYSGAVGTVFFKSSLGDRLQQAAKGRGTFILTASTGLQTAVEKEGERYGLLTKHIIEGIQTGAADRDEDGLISVDELYSYVHDQVLDESPQEPEMYSKARGDVIISQSPRMPRNERRLRGRELLLDLAKQHKIPDKLFSKAWEVVWTDPGQWSEEIRRYERLIESLLLSHISVPDFVAAWYEFPQTASANVLEPPTGTSTAIRVGADQNTRPLPVLGEYVVLRSFPVQKRGVLACAFSPGGNWLATSSGDGCITLWNVQSERIRHRLSQQASPASSLAFSSDGRWLAAAGTDRVIRIWDAVTGGLIASKTAPGVGALLSITFGPSGHSLAVAGFGDELTLLENSEVNSVIRTGHSVVTCVLYLPSSPTIISSGTDKMIRVWNPHQRDALHAIPAHSGAILALAISPKAEILASGGRDGLVKLWDTQKWAALRVLRGHTHSILSLAFHPGGSVIASGSADDTIRLWQVESGELLDTIQTGHGGVHSLGFHPATGSIVSGGADGSIHLWNHARRRNSVLSSR